MYGKKFKSGALKRILRYLAGTKIEESPTEIAMQFLTTKPIAF